MRGAKYYIRIAEGDGSQPSVWVSTDTKFKCLVWTCSLYKALNTWQYHRNVGAFKRDRIKNPEFWSEISKEEALELTFLEAL